MKKLFTLLALASLALPALKANLIITGIVDGPLSGGTPKAIELYASANIANLSVYGLESANNGGAAMGPEFTFPNQSVSAGTFIYVSSESPNFAAYFGFAPAVFFESGVANNNGDDAIVLYLNGSIVDVLGQVGVDGSGTAWDHMDGWAYRMNNTGPNPTFNPAEWTFSGIDALDNTSTNATATNPFPIGTFGSSGPAADHVVTVQNFSFSPNPLTIELGETVEWQNISGMHNVNGQQSTFPNNPASFYSGTPMSGNWTYSYTFTVPGTYNYQCDPHAGSMQGIIIVNAPVTPVIPIYAIGDVDGVNALGVADSLTVECGLQGIVYGVDLQTSGSIQFTLIDEDEDGIAVFGASSSDAAQYVVTEGDEVLVYGTITQFNGLTQLTADSITVISTGNALMMPTVVTALNESTESQLVRLNGLTLVNPAEWTGSGSFNVNATNGSSNFAIRINSATDVGSLPAPTGTFDLIGIGGQFDTASPFTEGYQILPRYQADLITEGGGPLVNLVISEIFYNVPGEDEFPEFLEVYNNGSSAIDMQGYSISAVNFTIPYSLTVQPGSYVVFTNDSLTFSNLFGFAAYEWTFDSNLSNSGEAIVITNADGNTVDSVSYDDGNGWPESADGDGYSLVLCDYNSDNSDLSNWIAATTNSGVAIAETPIFANPGDDSQCPTSPKVAFLGNEGSASENSGSFQIGIVLSDGSANPNTVQIQVDAASTASSADYSLSATSVTFDEGLASDTIFISVNLTDDSEEEVLENLVLNLFSASDELIVIQPSSFTLSILDDDTPLPSLVISEINYNDPSSGNDTLEFIEIYNAGSGTVNMAGISFTQGIEYTFGNFNLGAGEYLLVAVNAEAMFNSFGVAALQWTSGGLSNSGEDIELTDASGNVIDYVDFLDDLPWDTLADGYGPSLQLCDLGADNNDVANWQASTAPTGVVIDGIEILATPGSANSTCSVSSTEIAASQISLYPNPASELLHIEAQGVAHVEIYNALGQRIHAQQLNSDRNDIQVGQWQAGVYYCIFRNGDAVLSKTFVKQ